MIMDKPENLLIDRSDLRSPINIAMFHMDRHPCGIKILKKWMEKRGPYNALQKALVPNSNVLYDRYSFDVYRILLTAEHRHP